MAEVLDDFNQRNCEDRNVMVQSHKRTRPPRSHGSECHGTRANHTTWLTTINEIDDRLRGRIYIYVHIPSTSIPFESYQSPTDETEGISQYCTCILPRKRQACPIEEALDGTPDGV